MATSFTLELQYIAEQVRALLSDAALRPDFLPSELLDAVLAYPQAGGKALRPAMLTWSCRALGGDVRAALRAGAAVELYHTYTLVHDDVIDRDPLRRGRPSVHALLACVGREHFGLSEAEAAHYGLSMAILAGDCQQAWSISLLTSLPSLGISPAIALQLIHRLEHLTGPAIVEGEARDIQLPFIPVAGVTSEAIYRVMRTKTAALFAYCGWAGGLLARGQEDDEVRALAAFGEDAGIAFQLQDDVLGLVGDEQKLGKPVGSDLREGKRTLIIALAWARASEGERALLTSVLGQPDAPPAAITEATALLRRLDAIDEVQTTASGYLNQAMQHLDRLPATPALACLRELAEKLMKREK